MEGKGGDGGVLMWSSPLTQYELESGSSSCTAIVCVAVTNFLNYEQMDWVEVIRKVW
jgi:hypothetical protein